MGAADIGAGVAKRLLAAAKGGAESVPAALALLSPPEMTREMFSSSRIHATGTPSFRGEAGNGGLKH